MNFSERPGAWGEGLQPGQQSVGPYAASGLPSRGRQWPEPDCPTRSPFQRDRDRVLHSASFRRLTYKTQVFVYHEGDHYRTRLTHSLEVAQIARTVARQLRLNEDLAEVLALAHDLGHPPFGHAGERALDAIMEGHGGFDHNVQSLRIVTGLEGKYANFDGLNLTWETLEGLAKHNGPISQPSPLWDIVAELGVAWESLQPDRWASGEAQVAALADDVAYLNHDIDDGLRAGLISLDDLVGLPVAGPIVEAARQITTEEARVVYEVTRRMITAMVSDLVGESRRRLAELKPQSPDDIRSAGGAVVGFSDGMWDHLTQIRAFLFERVYRSQRIMTIMTAAEQIVRDLFERYQAEPAVMPEGWHLGPVGRGGRRPARAIADFVSGMTDRYAIAEHRRLFDQTPELR